MVRRLQQNFQAANPFQDRFLSDRRADAVMAGMARNGTNLPPKDLATLLRTLALDQLDAGRSEDALRKFKAFEDLLAANRVQLGASDRVQLAICKGLAMLRIGEQENCISNHNADSCLLPLAPTAYHTIPRGSRGAVGFLNEALALDPSDLTARWLLNIAHMTLGEYPDKVPSRWLIPPKSFESDYNLPRYPDYAGALGLDMEGLAGGAIVDDFDGDGFLDVVTSNWALDGQLRLFHNEGNGRFTERTREAGLLGLVGGLNIMQTDYNNDGLLDIWVPRGAWRGKQGRTTPSLLRNNGDGSFTDVTEEAGLLKPHPSQTSVWFDYDGDGWLDLVVGNETTDPADPDPCELFHNNHNGTFTECAVASGIDVKAFVKGIACADYDNDGRPDLYFSILGKSGPNKLFHNDGPDAAGHWKFTEVGAKAGIGEMLTTFATFFFDYDNDGYEDLFVSGYSVKGVGDIAADYLGMPTSGARAKLYHNNRNGTFTDVTEAAHLNHVYLTMGHNFGDLDNDGWLDFYLGTGNPDLSVLVPNRMLRNAGGKYFQDVTTAGGFGHLQKGHGVAFADFDNDGQQDVFIVVGGAVPGDMSRCALFHNPGNTNHWVKLKLEGLKANRVAIGARIKVALETPSGPRDVYKTVNSGGSFGSSPLMQHIGLGDATSIVSVEISWPGSGLHQSVKGLALDHSYRLQEGVALPIRMDLKRIVFDPKAAPAHVHDMGKMK
jgi:hypothetical protein